MRALYKAGLRGISAYEVRGLRAETKSSFYTHHPFELSPLDEAVKLEVICTDESIDTLVSLIAEHARKGEPGDGLIAVQEVTDVADWDLERHVGRCQCFGMRICDIKQPS